MYIGNSMSPTKNYMVYRLPKLSDKIKQRRVRFAGHCSRRVDEPVSKLVH